MATSNRQLPLPADSALVSSTDNLISELSNKLDASASLSTGVLSARPSTPPSGHFYWATDALVLSVYVGAWLEVSASPPVGSLSAYAGAGDPADSRWVVADGRTISRTTYSVLFDLIGTTYGAGDSTSTFALPDLRGRVVTAADTGIVTGSAGRLTTNNVRGQSGGVDKVTLATSQIPAHGHPVTDPGHVHSVYDPAHTHHSPGDGFITPTGVTETAQSGTGTSYGVHASASGAQTGVQVESATTGVSVQQTGGGASHPNVQPHLTLSYIIRIR